MYIRIQQSITFQEWMLNVCTVITDGKIYSLIYYLHNHKYDPWWSTSREYLRSIFIVHWKTAIAVGHEKIKEVFFWANLLHPIFMLSLHFLIRPDFLFVYDAYRETDICLGDPKGNLDPARNKSLTKLHNLCELVHPTSESLVEISIYWLRSSLCWVQFVFFYFVLWNFLEIFFYILIFKFIHRYVN